MFVEWRTRIIAYRNYFGDHSKFLFLEKSLW